MTMRHYDDIIEYEYHGVQRHAHMSRSQRAAQFMPFAALQGYDALLEQTAHHTGHRVELSEDARDNLDRILHELIRRIPERPPVSLTYFQANPQVGGGEYRTVQGIAERYDAAQQCIWLSSGQCIACLDIIHIVLQ